MRLGGNLNQLTIISYNSRVFIMYSDGKPKAKIKRRMTPGALARVSLRRFLRTGKRGLAQWRFKSCRAEFGQRKVAACTTNNSVHGV